MHKLLRLASWLSMPVGPLIADLIISSLDSIQKQPPWAVALAEAMRDEWCSSHESAKTRLAISLQILSEKKFLPGPITKRLQGCFAIGRASMQVSVTSLSLRVSCLESAGSQVRQVCLPGASKH